MIDVISKQSHSQTVNEISCIGPGLSNFTMTVLESIDPRSGGGWTRMWILSSGGLRSKISDNPRKAPRLVRLLRVWDLDVASSMLVASIRTCGRQRLRGSGSVAIFQIAHEKGILVAVYDKMRIILRPLNPAGLIKHIAVR